ncbi:MobP2 family relaxase (plasmid) [Enterococcus sp. SB12]|uniref:MobP2 family relaxase n=1 Tax=Enterococcus sp. SB12 TaxID=3070812 RepID=UPI0027DA7FF6|nr:MobP2 family relaxase [Enterococcus sp. SB12]MDQ4658948.1 MobP2 family relaxase [Enterococcus sp. SB12]
MNKSPAVILTCQFTLPNKKSFSTYIDYMTREKALEEMERRTPEEEQELQRIKNALEDFYIPEGETFSESKTDKEFSETSNEAQSLMGNGINFDKLEEQDFTKYLSYMTRHYALEQKKELTQSEQKGSIIYQDVVSHDNSYLEKIGLYDTKTDTLDEEGLKAAGRKMMETLFEKEQLNETGYWMATIHRNTKHIHIHFAVVEKENTRKPYTEVENGVSYIVPKGKRRQATLDAMKTNYVHELERFSYEKDRIIGMEKRNLLTRKSDLRNSLTKVVKEPVRYDRHAMNLLNEVYRTLPEKRSEWNYGDENRTKLSPYTREKLDELTQYVLTKEPEYQEYIQISKALKEEAESLYGESKRESKDAEKNALFDLKKRTGNAILTELKRQDSQIKPLIESVDQMQSIYNERSFRTLKQLPTNEYKYSYEEFMKRRKQFQQRVVTQRSLRQLNRTINAHEEKYHASKVYEEQQRRIQMEQERQ